VSIFRNLAGQLAKRGCSSGSGRRSSCHSGVAVVVATQLAATVDFLGVATFSLVIGIAQRSQGAGYSRTAIICKCKSILNAALRVCFRYK